ncbi:MAG: response regulator [Gammaproteobacteria bacterium]|nr:response regulator [Gammaproteobacteria bacterium]
MPRVLIVDDQLISRMILEQLVRSIGDETEAVSFADPVEALEWAKDNPHDLVLTDLKMPNMNGVEFTQWLRKTPSCNDVPVVIITCMDDQTTKYRALEAGATDFLTKPIDHHECRARCRNLLKLREQQGIIRDRARWLEKEIADKTRELQLREKETLLRLAKAGEYRDSDTSGHVFRMANTTRMIAEALGKDAEYCDAIEQAAPMHDIGKIGVPDNILLKPGRLNARERAIMQHHARIGFEILRDSPSQYLQLGATIAWCHHERWDGAGYPRGIHGADIPLEARIVAIADVFDALLSERPYKPRWPVERAIASIRAEAGKHFDPACVDAMLQRLDEIVAARNLPEAMDSPGTG